MMSTPFPVDGISQTDNSYPQQDNTAWNSPASPTFLTSSPIYQQHIPTMIYFGPHYPVAQAGFGHNRDLGIQPPNYILPPSNNLYLEQAYLQDALQHENIKATDILRKQTALEGYLRRDYFPLSKRKMKKQITWLKQRLNQAAQQENAIFAQLGQVAYQIQRRQRAAQVQNESKSFDMNRMQGMQISPAVPPFQTKVLPSVHAPVTVWQHQLHDGYRWQEQVYDDQAEGYNDIEEISPLDVLVLSHESLEKSDFKRPSLPRKTVSVDDMEMGISRRSTFSPYRARWSLPNFPDISPIWNLTGEEMTVGPSRVLGELAVGSTS